MKKSYSGVGNPTHEYLGAGAIYFNYGLPSEVRMGVTKGGNEFNDNAEFREREADGDYAPVKGHRNITKFMPQLSTNALKLSTANLIKFMAGAKQDTTTPGETKIYRTINLSDSYIENVAFVGSNREGNFMVIVLKNALSDGPITIPTTPKEEEIVINPVFTAHIDDTFDPDDETTYPFYIIKDTSSVTFTVDDGASPIENAEVVFDAQYGQTNVTGDVTFNSDKGKKLSYTITAAGFNDLTGSVEIDEDVETVLVSMTAV
jgi:hypothetical protein